MGAFLLWTMAFVLADENAAALTGSVLEEPTPTAAETLVLPETTTWENNEEVADTTEATTWDTVEATSETDEETVEATETEADTTDADSDKAETTETNATEEDATTTSATAQKYDEEQVTAYEWALEKGITTIDNIDNARLSDGLTRAELAKMMSQYMTKVLWKTPADVEKANYADVNESLGDLADFIQTAYAYKIMWINADGTPLKEFNPNGKVTRAEYATVFSRVLFGDKYNKAEWNYYEDHLNALKEAGILTNTTPSITEVRGWVMLMMYRSSNVKIDTPTEETVWMANPASVYCEQQGWTVNIVKDEEGNESGMCKLADGTEVEEWEYYRANNTGAVESLYSEEDLAAAEAVIKDAFENTITVKVENVELKYLWDEKSTSELDYCKEFEEKAGITIDECVVFSSDFYIPEQDAEMAWAFEPNKTITGYQWYLGRTKGWEWKVLTFGY